MREAAYLAFHIRPVPDPPIFLFDLPFLYLPERERGGEGGACNIITFMASSSSSHKSLPEYDYDLVPCLKKPEPVAAVKAALDQEEEHDEGWLELGLGLGSSVAASKTQDYRPNDPDLPPAHQTQFQDHHHGHHIGVGGGGLGLGLKEGEIKQGRSLGLDNNNNDQVVGVREIDLAMMPPRLNYDHERLWSNCYYYGHVDHDQNYVPSSSSWPWPMEDSEEDGSGFLGDWQMPVPNSSSSSSLRRPNSSGLWFTLRASTNR